MKLLVANETLLVDAAELDGSRGRAVHNERGVCWEGSRVQRAAVTQQPAVLLCPIGENDHVRQWVEPEGVIEFPVDGPRC